MSGWYIQADPGKVRYADDPAPVVEFWDRESKRWRTDYVDIIEEQVMAESIAFGLNRPALVRTFDGFIAPYLPLFMTVNRPQEGVHA